MNVVEALIRAIRAFKNEGRSDSYISDETEISDFKEPKDVIAALTETDGSTDKKAHAFDKRQKDSIQLDKEDKGSTKLTEHVNVAGINTEVGSGDNKVKSTDDDVPSL